MSDLTTDKAYSLWRSVNEICGDPGSLSLEEITEKVSMLTKRKVQVTFFDFEPTNIRSRSHYIDDGFHILVIGPMDFGPIRLDEYFEIGRHLYNCLFSEEELKENDTNESMVNFMIALKRPELVPEIVESMTTMTAEAEYFGRLVAFNLFGNKTPRVQALEKRLELISDPTKVMMLVKTIREGRVLLLGSYVGKGLERLNTIKGALESSGMEVLVFRELRAIEETIDKDSIREEVQTLARLVEFVVVEDSESSGHLIELTDLVISGITTAVLREREHGSTILTLSLFRKYKAFMEQFEYTETTLMSVITSVKEWAVSVNE